MALDQRQSRGVLGGAGIKHWAKMQPTVALSSGEPQYASLVEAAAEGSGIQPLDVDLG